MANWQSGDVETNGIRLHYMRTGGDRPPLVLAHGVTDDGLCWTPVAEALEAGYDVIMVDARGHGRSEAPEHGYDPLTLATDLYGLITALNLRKPIILGHSLGARTALVLAGTYPDAPGAILLEDPPGAWAEAPKPAEDQDQAGKRAAAIYGRDQADEEPTTSMQDWFSAIKRKTRAELIAEQHTAAPSWSDGELQPWADSKLHVSPNVREVFDPRMQQTVDWPATLRRITCPALLITADIDRGAILTEEAAAALRAFVPQLQIVHIPKAGHNIRREQFGRFMEVVRAFLAEH